jgi:hypothetical protein
MERPPWWCRPAFYAAERPRGQGPNPLRQRKHGSATIVHFEAVGVLGDRPSVAMPTVATTTIVYAFDVDDTLEVSNGPVKMRDLVTLREQGHIVGLCGNWAVVTMHYPDWHRVCSFVGPCGIEKHDFLRELRRHVVAADYVLVGNVLGVSGASDDRGAAQQAGWRFIQEAAFATGRR